jgi:hypothetical protein
MCPQEKGRSGLSRRVVLKRSRNVSAGFPSSTPILKHPLDSVHAPTFSIELALPDRPVSGLMSKERPLYLPDLDLAPQA